MARTKDFDEQCVLEKAMHLFWLKGYNATSMQDLVDELGISRSSLYDTYGDKHSLFMQALKNYQANNHEQVKELVRNTASTKEVINKILANIVNELTADKEHKGCFLVNASVEMAPGDKEVGDMLCQNDRQMEDFFYETLKAGQQKGEITNAQDARLLAKFIINNIKGLRVASKSAADAKVFNDIIALTLSVLG
jgi:TetR/AcrR family transcriptional repressor of nem operon